MATIAMAVLAASVAAGYFTIAALVAPRMSMPSAGSRTVLVLRTAAIGFFVGCGMTHVHILAHILGFGTPRAVETHELVFHAMQAIGAWLFIAGALLRFELQVVPAERRIDLEAAVAEQRELADHARLLARRDELTGLARRWRFDEELERQVGLARERGTSGALVLLDIDDFKTVNDTYGHQVGDAVLQRVAGQLTRGLREADLAARIGGDEFAIILPDATLQQGAAVAERIMASLRGPWDDAAPDVSISAGIAAIDGARPTADIVRRADRALYGSKHAGGNCYIVDEPAPAPARVG